MQQYISGGAQRHKAYCGIATGTKRAAVHNIQYKTMAVLTGTKRQYTASV